MKKPLIGITMGDPAGIGAEVIIKAFSQGSLPHSIRPFVIGDSSVIKRYLTLCGESELVVKSISSPQEWEDGVISVLDVDVLKEGWEVGEISANCGDAAFRYIEKSIQLANDGEIDAVVTCPINKEALKAAGHNYPGHTEIYAEYTNTKDFTMMFKLDKVSVVHCTTHCSLLDAIKKIDSELVLTNIKLLQNALIDLGTTKPKIAVAGLNPHAGENGLFGTEEIEHIIPAIHKAQESGIDVSGPYPPDTVFMKAFKGEFDGVVAQLHDHGFVALKSRDFEKGVNITVGLPIIRTSVGHGTAFDIAGKNRASAESLISAIDSAKQMAISKL